MNDRNNVIFNLERDDGLGGGLAELAGCRCGHYELRRFEGGEHKICSLDPVAGRVVYVVQSLYGDAGHSVNDKLIMLLFFIGALRDAGAASITVIAPYLCYMRKDCRTKFQDPLSGAVI